MASRGYVRRLVAAVLSFTLLVSVVQVAPAAAKAVAPAPVKRELTDERTAYSRTWDNGDGTRTYEAFLEPRHYRDPASSAWLPIDTTLDATLTPSGRALTNRSNAFRFTLPEGIADADVTIGTEEASIRLRPKGRVLEKDVFDTFDATSSAVPMDGRTRRYAKAFNGADLLYESTARGLKETIVLAAPPSHDTFSFDMTCPGLVPSLDASGGVAFTRDSTGAVLFSMLSPYMTDASVDEAGEPAYSDAVRYELTRRGVGWRLDVVADAAWLADPARVYPVEIDPTTYISGAFWAEDAFVTSAYPSTNYGTATELKTGRVNASGTGINRTYVKPDISGILGKGYSVLSAKLELYCFWKYYQVTLDAVSTLLAIVPGVAGAGTGFGAQSVLSGWTSLNLGVAAGVTDNYVD
ncbi:MAG: DNRLRE domain-containing protein [Actinomycetota bacterium]|nr:DNRLRE domain-containing protein [Actinomycetota bacterium]